jgi:signal transduction histidine kinase/ligand-binding sensor domain-containing protein
VKGVRTMAPALAVAVAMARALAAALMWLAFAGAAHALDGGYKLVDFHHDIWTGREGAPADVSSMTQTNDGWLWLGTYHGLYRFDGHRFEKYAPQTGEKLLSQGISALWADDNGELWIGYLSGGMSVLRDGKLRHIAAQRLDTPVTATYNMARDADGSMWVATNGGLIRYFNGAWQKIGAASGLNATPARDVVIDHYGRLWVLGDKFYVLDRGTGKFHAAGAGGGDNLVTEAPDGRVWELAHGSWRALPDPAGVPRTPVPANRRRHTSAAEGLFDRDGNHWQLNCPVGLCFTPASKIGADHFPEAPPGVQRLDQPWQMSSLTGAAIFEDREGNIWISTLTGLERFRLNRMVAVEVPAGQQVLQLARDDQGVFWSASRPGGYVFKVGKDVPLVLDSSHKRPLLVTATDGSLLFADHFALERRRGGKTTVYPFPDGPDGQPMDNYPAAACGNADSAWVRIAFRATFHLKDGKWSGPNPYGLPKGIRSQTCEKNGVAWFAYHDGSLIRFEDGRLRTVLRAGESEVGVASLVDAQDGVVLAGDKGLAVMIDGKFTRLFAADQEALTGISGLAITADGDRWLNGAKGVVHIRGADWKSALAQPASPLRYEVFDAMDGLIGMGALAPGVSAHVADDGTLMFATTSGIVTLNPANLHRNTLPPPLAFTAVQTPERSYTDLSALVLPPGTSSLRIDYTALSFVMPEKIRFQYMLEGVDAGWQDVGTMRLAIYTRLGAGQYRFHLKAVNEDGVASVGDTVLGFTIEPTFIQTPLFTALCALLAGLLLYALYVFRVRRVTRRYGDRMKERMAERERIARTLHDTLLQGVQGIILKVHGVGRTLPGGDAARGALDTIMDEAEELVNESRHQILAIRRADRYGDRLDQALAEAGELLQENFDTPFRLQVAGRPEAIDNQIAEEIYHIVREAMLNAYKHAQAATVTLDIDFGRKALTLRVRDDGKGIDAEVRRNGGRAGHFGLSGMRERAAAIGATLDIVSREGQGAQLILKVPASGTYLSARRRRWW